MNTSDLHKFYEETILPKFGIEKRRIEWKINETIGWDDYSHYFEIDHGIDTDYFCLIFRDYGAFYKEEIEKLVRLPKGTFTYINPISNPKSRKKHHHAFIFPDKPTSKYQGEVTGYFTLIKID